MVSQKINCKLTEKISIIKRFARKMCKMLLEAAINLSDSQWELFSRRPREYMPFLHR
jgi:hypothetical protein